MKNIKQSQNMKFKNLSIKKSNLIALQKFAKWTKELLCPLTENNKLHVTKQTLTNAIGTNFFKLVAKRFNVNLNFVKDNQYKVACYYSHNQLNININAYDSIKAQKFYLAHMLGHLEFSWHYLPDALHKSIMPKANLKLIRQNHNLLQICGCIHSYNLAENEYDANYFAKKLLGYDLL